MSKYLLVLLLLLSNIYANKNWIKFDTKKSNSKNSLKMTTSKSSTSSLAGLKNPNQKEEVVEKRNTTDKDLIEFLGKIQNLRTNIKSQLTK